MYIDKSAALYNAANELGFDRESQKKYDIMVAEAKGFDEKALPWGAAMHAQCAFEWLKNHK